MTQNGAVLLQTAALIELLAMLNLLSSCDNFTVIADDLIGERHRERVGAHRQDGHDGKAQEHHKRYSLYPAFSSIGTDCIRAAGDLGDLPARYGFLSHFDVSPVCVD